MTTSSDDDASDRLRFLVGGVVGVGTGALGTVDIVGVTGGAGATGIKVGGGSAVISVDSFDFRGPRFIPGLPRPRPFPE